MTLGFVIRLNDGETWREFVRRHSAKEGLEEECLGVFDSELERGEEEAHAAFSALYEWDCCPVEEIPK